MKLADEINIKLQRDLRNKQHKFVIPNFYFKGFEADVFSVLRSGYTEEYEIKISKADFKCDFNKTEIAERRWDSKLNKAVTIRQGEKKHDLLIQGKRTNRFYFVVPEGLIIPEEIPEYAGLYYYSNGWFKLAKSPKLLHKVKIAMPSGVLFDIANRCYSRYVHINWQRYIQGTWVKDE